MNDTVPNVIVIPAKVETPQEQDKKRHLRVAAYCRVSTDSEEQLSSYENQLSYYTEKIMKEPGWTMAGVFADEGITGTSTCKRKEFLRMIRQCRQGKIDMILAKSVSRFARNTVDTLNFTRELRSLGIPVVFEEQNINSIYPESEFLITLHGAFAQAESESTSSRVRWGKRQAMKSGHVAMQYKQLLGYEKGPDGKPRIVPEQAETVRFIYDRYLAGDSIREIKVALEGQRIPTVSGKVEWMGSHIRSILTNEKYCGDVLLQKTFIQDCISKKVIPNTGQLPKYLIQNHHEGIVSREIFDAVQLEMARRNAKAGATRKSTPTGRGKYSGKHVLSNLLFCGECGTAYRRCVWTQRGVKRPVWRCVSRLDYGKKFCTQSPTLDEEPLQQAILAAVNAVMLDRDTLARQLAAVMEWELAPVLGESMSLADISQQPAVLRGVRDGLPAVRVDPARNQAPRVAVCQPPGLWEEVLHPVSHPRRGTAPAGHPGRCQRRHAGPGHPGPAARRRHGVGAGPGSGGAHEPGGHRPCPGGTERPFQQPAGRGVSQPGRGLYGAVPGAVRVHRPSQGAKG